MYTHNCLIKLFLFKPDRICLQGASTRGGCPYAGPSAPQAGEASQPHRRSPGRRRLPEHQGEEHHGPESGHRPVAVRRSHACACLGRDWQVAISFLLLESTEPSQLRAPLPVSARSILLRGMRGMRTNSQQRLIRER